VFPIFCFTAHLVISLLLPDLSFRYYDSAGTGKTTTALALARALYGHELYRSRILELNASDERGIKVVREKIKTFAQGAVSHQKVA
jgi:replication factor C subunit 2/4